MDKDSLQSAPQNVEACIQGEIAFYRDLVGINRLVALIADRTGRGVIDSTQRRLHRRKSGQNRQRIA